MAVEAENIVEEWLRALHLGYYAESFIENGYDDLEICKQIGPADLDAIGVFSTPHRARILEAVKSLREEGATSVYFTLDEVAHDECNCTESESNGFLGSSRASSQRTTRSSRMSSPRTSSTRMSSRSEPGMGGLQGTSSSTGGGSGTVLSDDEERLVAIPKNQLRILLKEKLMKDGVRLSYPPYSKSDGSAGNLEGLASRYADFFKTQYVDVLDLLQEFRRREWEEMRSGRSNRLPPRPQSRASTNRSSSPPPPAPSGAQSQSSSSPMTPHAQWGSSTSHSSAASPSPMHPPTNVQSDGRLQERGGPFNLPLLGPPTSSQPPCSAPSPMANNCSAAPPQHLQCDMLRGVPGGFSSRGNQSATNSPLGSPMGLPPAFVLEGGRPHPLSALYTPGKYQPSSCLSDAEEREIYGYGLPAKGKKKFFRSQGSADSGSKRLLSPDRCGLTRMCIYDAAGYEGVQASCSSRQTNGRNPGSGPFGHRGPPGYPMKKAKGHSGTGTLSRLFRTLRVQKGAGDHGRRKRPDKGEVESPDPQTLAADPLITPVPPSSIFTTNQTPSAFSFAPPTSQAPPPPDRTTTTPTSIASGDNIPSPYCNLNGPPIMAKDFVGSDPLLGSPTTDREVIGIGEAIERYKQIERQKRMQEQREQSMGLMGEQRKDQMFTKDSRTGMPSSVFYLDSSQMVVGGGGLSSSSPPGNSQELHQPGVMASWYEEPVDSLKTFASDIRNAMETQQNPPSPAQGFQLINCSCGEVNCPELIKAAERGAPMFPVPYCAECCGCGYPGPMGEGTPLCCAEAAVDQGGYPRSASVGNISSTGLDFGPPSMGPGGEPFHPHCFDDAHLTGAHGNSKVPSSAAPSTSQATLAEKFRGMTKRFRFKSSNTSSTATTTGGSSSEQSVSSAGGRVSSTPAALMATTSNRSDDLPPTSSSRPSGFNQAIPRDRVNRRGPGDAVGDMLPGSNGGLRCRKNSGSSIDSLPSGSGSSTRPLVPSVSSNRSSISADENNCVTNQGAADNLDSLPIIAKARAICDCTPTPYDKELLKFKKGDLIDVISKSQSGNWRGRIGNRVGTFKFVNVKLLTEEEAASLVSGRRRSPPVSTLNQVSSLEGRGIIGKRPRTVEELLKRMKLEKYMCVFIVNGYDSVEAFKDLTDEHLDDLDIQDIHDRRRILEAADALHFSEESDEALSNNSQLDLSGANLTMSTVVSEGGAVPASAPGSAKPVSMMLSNLTDELKERDSGANSGGRRFVESTEEAPLRHERRSRPGGKAEFERKGAERKSNDSGFGSCNQFPASRLKATAAE